MDDIYLLSERACTELANQWEKVFMYVPMQMTLLLQEHTNYVLSSFYWKQVYSYALFLQWLMSYKKDADPQL